MITIESLTKRYGPTVAVDGLSFAARAGRVTALLGPNGAGKTTTLRILLGLARPDAGSATIDGRPYRDLPDPARSVGAVLEESTFHPGHTARTHLRSLACAAGLPPGRVDEVTTLVDLDHAADRRTGGYSLGMWQRLSIASALLGDPRVLVLDEPQNGLDPHGVRWLRDLLRSLAGEGRAVLVSSHLLSEMSQVADDVIIVSGGRLVRQATLGELVEEITDGVRARTPHRDRLVDLLAEQGWPASRLDFETVLARGCSPPELAVLAVEHGIALYELAPQRHRLEDVFLQLTGTD